MLLTATKSSSGSVTILIIFVIAYLAIYMLFLRPRMRKNKAMRMAPRQFEVGDQVQTVGGLIGTVTSIDLDNVVTLRTHDGVSLQFLRAAIAQRYQAPSAIPDIADPDSGTHEGDAT